MDERKAKFIEHYKNLLHEIGGISSEFVDHVFNVEYFDNRYNANIFRHNIITNKIKFDTMDKDAFIPIYININNKKIIIGIILKVGERRYIIFGNYKSADAEYRRWAQFGQVLLGCKFVLDMYEPMMEILKITGAEIECSYEDEVVVYKLAFIILHFFDKTPAGYYSSLSFKFLADLKPIFDAMAQSKTIWPQTTVIITGMKTIQLTPAEISNKFNIRFKVWRELYILNLINLAKYNLVAPDFPYSVLACFCKYPEYLYVNDSIIYKMKLSKYIIHYHKYGEHALKHIQEDKDLFEPNIYDDLVKTFSNGDIDVNNSTYTETVLSVIMESYGYSIESVALSIADNSNHVGLKSEHNPFLSVELLQGILFSYFYSITVMHNRLDIIHGDIHTNNLLVFIIYNSENSELHPQHELYIVDGKYYVKKCTMPRPLIIDFGRSILGKSHRTAVGKHCGDIAIEDFYSDQISLYIRILQRYFPDFLDGADGTLNEIILNNMDTAFNIIALTDYLGVCESLIDSANVIKSTPGASDCITYLSKIAAMVETKINQHLKQFCKDPDYKVNISYDILHEIFYPIYGEEKSTVESGDKYKHKFANIYSSNFLLKYNRCANKHWCEEVFYAKPSITPSEGDIMCEVSLV